MPPQPNPLPTGGEVNGKATMTKSSFLAILLYVGLSGASNPILAEYRQGDEEVSLFGSVQSMGSGSNMHVDVGYGTFLNDRLLTKGSITLIDNDSYSALILTAGADYHVSLGETKRLSGYVGAGASLIDDELESNLALMARLGIKYFSSSRTALTLQYQAMDVGSGYYTEQVNMLSAGIILMLTR